MVSLPRRFPNLLLVFSAVALVLILRGGCAIAFGPGETIGSIHWSDGDSGRIDGEPFRLADVDAPETGGVGARGGAKCEAERALGYRAREFMVERTRGARVAVTARHGVDRYERAVVDLSADGEDLARAGIAARHLAPWPHRNGRAETRKPSWC